MSNLAYLNCKWPSEFPYEKIRVLGSGSYGGVWLAKSKDPANSNDLVAVKTIYVSSEGSEEYAIREIKILSQLNHPYCTKLIESFGIFNDIRFFAITLGKGPTIQYLLKTGGALGLPLAVQISRQLIEAVAYLHSHAVIHRDLKPDNCIIVGAHSSDDSIWSNGDDAKEKVQEGIWKLMLVDFGFARSLTPEDLLIDSKNCQINQEHTLFSLDKAIDKTTSVITNESLSAKDILDLSAIGSKSFAAPEISRNMKKNTRLFSAKSNEKRSSYSEFVSSYSMASDAFSLGCLLRYTFTGVPPQYSIDDYISQQNSVVCLKLKTLFRCVRKKKERDICYRNNCMVPEEIRSIIGALSSLDKSKRISVRACLRSMLTSEEMEELSFSLDTTTFLKVIEISEIESHTCCSETDASN